MNDNDSRFLVIVGTVSFYRCKYSYNYLMLCISFAVFLKKSRFFLLKNAEMFAQSLNFCRKEVGEIPFFERKNLAKVTWEENPKCRDISWIFCVVDERSRSAS